MLLKNKWGKIEFLNEDEEVNKLSFVDYIPIIFTLIVITAQIVLTFVLWDNYYDIDVLVYIGYGFWVLSAIFGVLPIFTFRRKGGVEKGDSYIKTTTLVNTGLYGIVRHPQFLSGILISIALALMSQYWVIIILLIIPITCTFIDTIKMEKRLVIKFGEEYINYQRQVPRLYPLFGLLKLIIRKIRQRKERKRNGPDQ